MKTILHLAILTAALAAFAAPYRELTEVEKRIAAAKAECCANYDKIEAHYKFAGVLYDAGCLESAFCNVESLLRSTAAPLSGKALFEANTRRQLKDFFPPEFLQQLNKFPPELRDTKYRDALKTLAAKDPDAAAYSAFAANAKLWRSTKKEDIITVTETIISSEPKLKHLLRYNLSAAHYLYFTAKDEDAALGIHIGLIHIYLVIDLQSDYGIGIIGSVRGGLGDGIVSNAVNDLGAVPEGIPLALHRLQQLGSQQSFRGVNSGYIVRRENGHKDGQQQQRADQERGNNGGLVLGESAQSVLGKGSSLCIELCVINFFVSLGQFEVIRLEFVFAIILHYFFAPILILGSINP